MTMTAQTHHCITFGGHQAFNPAMIGDGCERGHVGVGEHKVEDVDVLYHSDIRVRMRCSSTVSARRRRICTHEPQPDLRGRLAVRVRDRLQVGVVGDGARRESRTPAAFGGGGYAVLLLSVGALADVVLDLDDRRHRRRCSAPRALQCRITAGSPSPRPRDLDWQVCLLDRDLRAPFIEKKRISYGLILLFIMLE